MTREVRFRGWETVEKLGEGGMCAVYRVRSEADPGIERAIKVLTEHRLDARERFREEAQILIGLDHPNVIEVHELVDEDPPWQVMELLAGRDLEEVRDAGEPIRPELLASWMADLCSGLAAVHALGVVHRDIKPSNIMLGLDGVPRLIDFGVARDTAAAHRTEAGMVIGTASFLPPEVFLDTRSRQAQDRPAADVYALGQTLCELLVGRPIHDVEDYAGPQMLVRIMRDKIARPHLDPREWSPSVPEGLASIVIDATRQAPAERIATARELEDRLRGWLRGRSRPSAAPVSRAAPTLPPPRSPSPGPAESSEAPSPTRTRTAVRTAGIGLVGAGAMGLLGAVLAGIAGLAVLGLALLVAFAPDPADRAVRAVLLEVAEARASALHGCAGRAGSVDLAVEVRGGRVASVEVTGVETAAAACIEAEVRGWSLGEVTGRAGITVVLE